MNQLKNESSPYLQQHADNPVHWMPWSEKAFEIAKKENKPVLLSIGYSSCHWCHVMAHESFEDIETAELMNKLFVNIKLDREEYPDIDHYYMDAVQAMIGSGGWPLNVFLTPDKKAFYGGTYFPPKPVYGRASWKEVLQKISEYYHENRSQVEQQAQQLFTHLKNANQFPSIKKTDKHEEENIFHERIFENIIKSADVDEGGFGKAPKFPSTFTIKFLLDYAQLYNNEKALHHACLSLDKMAFGGIYDQIRGGFARYSTDKYWKAPHFEKMLYDNALLIEVYSIAYAITKKELYKTIVRETIEWLKLEMLNVDGVFYSAIDADSEGVEGKFYTWTYEELKSILQEDFSLAEKYYQIKKEGNWEHTNILWTNSLLYENTNQRLIQNIKKKLLTEREKRIKPFKDTKIILSWNALMAKALAQASIVFQNDEYLKMAEQTIHYINEKISSKEHLYFHTCIDNSPKIPAYLDDLAYLTDACIALNQASGKTKYLETAQNIIHYINNHFQSETDNFYYFTNKDYQNTATNKIEIYDGALPSSNATITKCLLHLTPIQTNSEWMLMANSMVDKMKSLIEQYPLTFSLWANIVILQNTSYEINISGEKAVEETRMIYSKLYKPNIRLILNSDNKIKNSIMKNQYQKDNTLIYACYQNTCYPPFASNERLITFFFK